jgi:hypothetical protein
MKYLVESQSLRIADIPGGYCAARERLRDRDSHTNLSKVVHSPIAVNHPRFDQIGPLGVRSLC